mmetsp:Transcript_117010/g.233175  ORF Transcript_117010/g.233175 Transcript_117010/m.233175 type:complete len:273 (+) Transcript_117010:347-1165(+)
MLLLHLALRSLQGRLRYSSFHRFQHPLLHACPPPLPCPLPVVHCRCHSHQPLPHPHPPHACDPPQPLLPVSPLPPPALACSPPSPPHLLLPGHAPPQVPPGMHPHPASIPPQLHPPPNLPPFHFLTCSPPNQRTPHLLHLKLVFSPHCRPQFPFWIKQVCILPRLLGCCRGSSATTPDIHSLSAYALLKTDLLLCHGCGSSVAWHLLRQCSLRRHSGPILLCHLNARLDHLLRTQLVDHLAHHLSARSRIPVCSVLPPPSFPLQHASVPCQH